MPDELLLLVLSYLNKKTLISLQEVSVGINRLSKDKSLWKNFISDGLLLTIFSYLSRPTLLKLQEVSKRVNKLTKNKHLWNNYNNFVKRYHKVHDYVSFIDCYKDDCEELIDFGYSIEEIKDLEKYIPKDDTYYPNCCILDFISDIDYLKT